MKTNELVDLLSQDLPTEPLRPGAVLLRWLPVAAACGLVLLLSTLGPRSGLATNHVIGVTLPKWGFGFALAIAAGIAALKLARPDAPRAGVATSAAAVAAALGVAFAVDSTGQTLTAMPLGAGFKCLVVVPLLALPLTAAFLMALREGAVTRPRLAGGLAGAAAAGVATVIYALHCIGDGAAFMAIWYVAAALISGTIGAFAAPRALRW